MSLFEHFKETYLLGLRVYTSLIDVVKYYDLFNKEIQILLTIAGFKSIKTKLDTVREIKIKFLMSLGDAEQFIGLDRNGVYEHPKPSTFLQTEKGIEGLVQRVEELNKNMKEPLIVSKANKRVYEDIVTLLDREEEMILIELRNGKSLDYSPLNDKKDNGNPTTSATVEKSKKELTFDNLFPSVEDKEMVMKMLIGLKIINSEGKYLLESKRGIIRVFIDVMKEEGYFVDIDRKPILRIFTPVIIGKTIEVIKKPSDFEVKKRQILKKLIELKK